MEAYHSDGRGRYGTGESYDWFYKYEDDEDVQIETSQDGLWTYTSVDGGIEILRYNGNQIHIVVPAMIDGKDVVAMDSVFDGFDELKSVEIPEGVVSIVGVFYGCEDLESVMLPGSIVDMTYAFNCCYSLKKIAIPSGVRDFSQAFSGTSLKNAIFPQGTEDITGAFRDSEYLECAVIPKSVIHSHEAFADCEVLSDVFLEEGLTSIEDWAFYHCLSLLELTIPKSVTKLGKKSVGFMEIREYDAQKTGFKIKGEQIVPGFKIKGTPGSAAETYAQANGIEFVALS